MSITRLFRPDTNHPLITTEEYASVMAALCPEFSVVIAEGSEQAVKYAFNLLLYIGEHSHADTDYAHPRMSGFGGHETPYQKMDELLVAIISRRSQGYKQMKGAEIGLPVTSHRWSEADADVGPFKTGPPNKQQWKAMHAQRKQWTKNRSAILRERREKAEDWASNALQELISEREHLAAFGLKGYFTQSIAKLRELVESTTLMRG